MEYLTTACTNVKGIIAPVSTTEQLLHALMIALWLLLNTSTAHFAYECTIQWYARLVLLKGVSYPIQRMSLEGLRCSLMLLLNDRIALC